MIKRLDLTDRESFEEWKEGEEKFMIRGPGVYWYIKVDGSEEERYDVQAIDIWNLGNQQIQRIPADKSYVALSRWRFNGKQVVKTKPPHWYVCKDEKSYRHYRNRYKREIGKNWQQIFNEEFEVNPELFNKCQGLLERSVLIAQEKEQLKLEGD